jgi:hypothetical protein
MLQYLVLIGATANLFGAFSYIKETIGGGTKPNRMTWLLWSIAPLIATIAALADGVRWSVLPVFMSGFVPLLVFISSFVNKNSYWKLEKFDYLCGFFSVLALILWGITKEPAIAIIFAIASDGSAALPTLVKAWEYPDTETGTPYVTGVFNALTSFAAIKIWNFSSLAFPVYLVVTCTLLASAVYRKKIFKK